METRFLATLSNYPHIPHHPPQLSLARICTLVLHKEALAHILRVLQLGNTPKCHPGLTLISSVLFQTVSGTTVVLHSLRVMKTQGLCSSVNPDARKLITREIFDQIAFGEHADQQLGSKSEEAARFTAEVCKHDALPSCHLPRGTEGIAPSGAFSTFSSLCGEGW